jgi:transposase
MTAPATPVTVGVDTHRDLQVAAMVDQAGRLLDTRGFPASTRGDVALVALVTWAGRLGPVQRIGVEGTGTDGAGLARFVRADGLQAVEVDRPDRSMGRRRGRSDPIDPDRRPGRRPRDPGRDRGHHPKTREGQVGMVRVPRVVRVARRGRRGAMKARVAAAEQLHGVRDGAPKRCAPRCWG